MNTLETQVDSDSACSGSDYQPSAIYLVRGLYKLARGWQDKGDLVAAERIYCFILRIRDRNPALKCPEFVQSLANLASVRASGGSYMEAERLYVQALCSCCEILGEDNQICAEILREYAALLRRLQLTAEARSLERRADRCFKLALPVTISA